MVLLYLFLGHFIADFLLQPSNLVAWKNKSWKGVAVHVIIHFLVTSILLYLYIGSTIIFLLSTPIAAAHFCIDSLKASHERKSKHSVLAYWIDQFFHYLSLIIVYFSALSGNLNLSPLAGPFNSFFALYTNSAILIFFSLAIFVTYTLEYSKIKNRQLTTPNQDRNKAKNMIKRLFIFTLIYSGFLFIFPNYLSAGF